MSIYTDEHLKWDKPPMAVCLSIDLLRSIGNVSLEHLVGRF